MENIITNNQSYIGSKCECSLGDMILEGRDKRDYSDEVKNTFLGIFSRKTNKINNLRSVNVSLRLKCATESVKEMSEKNKYEIPSNDELVIHLRLGDVFHLPVEKHQHNNKRPDLNKILGHINGYKGENITFVTAFSHGKHKLSEDFYVKKSQEKSKEFFNELVGSIPKDKKIKIKSSENIDEDLVYLCMAHNLVITGKSHFGLAAEKINKILKKEKL